MDNEVEISTATKLAGLFDITVSKCEDTVFISHNKANSPGLANSIALYETDEGRIKSSGINLMYDKDTDTLKASLISVEKEITSKKVISENIISNAIRADVITSNTVIEGKSLLAEHLTVSDITKLNFLAILEKKTGDGFGYLNVDDFGNGKILAFVTKKENGELGCAIHIDSQQRVTISDGILNFNKKRVIKSSKGEPGDRRGDIAFNNYYLYFCTKDYDGVSSIWVRWLITDRQW
jgi:hypothetical protein